MKDDLAQVRGGGNSKSSYTNRAPAQEQIRASVSVEATKIATEESLLSTIPAEAAPKIIEKKQEQKIESVEKASEADSQKFAKEITLLRASAPKVKKGDDEAKKALEVSPEIVLAKERARVATTKRASEIIKEQELALKEATKEVTKIASEREKIRGEVVNILKKEDAAFSQITKIIQEEEATRAETLKIASAEKRKETKIRAEEAEQIAEKERVEAEGAQKKAEKETAEAETAKTTALNERKKADVAAETEAKEILKADEQAEAAIFASINELSLIKDKARKKAEEVLLAQQKAREAEALEVLHVTGNEGADSSVSQK